MQFIPSRHKEQLFSVLYFSKLLHTRILSPCLLFARLNNPGHLFLTHRSDFVVHNLIASSKLSLFCLYLSGKMITSGHRPPSEAFPAPSAATHLGLLHKTLTYSLSVALPVLWQFYIATICSNIFVPKHKIPVSWSENVHCAHFCFQHEPPESTLLWFCFYYLLPIHSSSRITYYRRKDMFKCFKSKYHLGGLQPA